MCPRELEEVEAEGGEGGTGWRDTRGNIICVRGALRERVGRSGRFESHTSTS